MQSDAVAVSATLLGEPLPVELINTARIGRDGMQDALVDDSAVAVWLDAVADRLPAEARTSPDQAGPDVAARLRELRDALRRLAADVTDDPRSPAGLPARQDAIDTINALASTWPELTWPADGEPAREWRAAGPPSGLAVSVIAHQAVELFAGAQRTQLRACLAPRCYRYFLKQHPRREWCSPVCGNRVRVSRHYRRHQRDDRAPGRTR
jgi:predicted RNA-binding Zn ribbon-like protein